MTQIGKRDFELKYIIVYEYLLINIFLNYNAIYKLAEIERMYFE